MPRSRLAVLLAALVLVAPATAAAQAEPPTLSVTGLGTVEARPDTATIGLVVRKVSPTREGARTVVNRRTSQVIASLTRLGIAREEIRTSGITLEQQRSRPRAKGRRLTIRYIGTNQLTVRTRALELVGRVFDVATASGATEFNGPDFTLETRTPARADATTAAITDARRRAEAAAAALGLRVTGVRSVALDPGDSPTPSSAGSDGSSLPTTTTGTAAPTPAEPGTEIVDARVVVVFELGA